MKEEAREGSNLKSLGSKGAFSNFKLSILET